MSHGLWIGGELVAASSDETIDVLNPYTEEVIGRVPAATPADVERAVERAVHLHEIARK